MQTLGTNFFFGVSPGAATLFPYAVTISLVDFIPLAPGKVISGTFMGGNYYDYYSLDPAPVALTDTADSYEVVHTPSLLSVRMFYQGDSGNEGKVNSGTYMPRFRMKMRHCLGDWGQLEFISLSPNGVPLSCGYTR